MRQSKSFPRLALPPDKLMGLPIHTDWCVWAGLRELEADTDTKRRKALCDLVYVREQPADIRRSEYEIMSWWYGAFDFGRETREGTDDSNPKKPAFCFLYDFETILADFWKSYGIDLYEGLHWYKFVRLFAGLGADSGISSLMQLRQKNIAEIKDPKDRSHYMHLQKIYALPLTSEEQTQEDAMNKIRERNKRLSEARNGR